MTGATGDSRSISSTATLRRASRRHRPTRPPGPSPGGLVPFGGQTFFRIGPRETGNRNEAVPAEPDTPRNANRPPIFPRSRRTIPSFPLPHSRREGPFPPIRPLPPLGIPFSSPTAPVPIRYLDVARDGTAVTEPKAITRQEERPHAENGKERRFAFLHVPPERPAKRTAESGFVRDESEPHPPEKRRSRIVGSSAFYFSGEALPPRSTLPGTVSSVPATLSGRRKTAGTFCRTRPVAAHSAPRSKSV